MTPLPLVIASGPHGEKTAHLLGQRLPAEVLISPPDVTLAIVEAFRAGRPVIGLMAAGILIRAVAPLLSDKWSEPPVIAVSAEGAHIAPLLGGHRGGNELAGRIAWLTGGNAAITTAMDNRFAIALDAPPPGWALANREDVKAFSAALLRGGKVRLDGQVPGWLRAALPEDEAARLRISVTERKLRGDADHLVLHPQVVMIGAGCARGAAAAEVISLAEESLKAAGLAKEAVAAVGTISLKADEEAINALAEHFGVPLRLFEAEKLAQVAVPNPSSRVAREVGTPSVAEAAALMLAGKGGRLLAEKRKSAAATCAIAAASVPQARLAGVARGRLFVVGLGPGDARMRTPQASAALAAAEDWVGYGLYLDLAGDMAAGRRLHPFPLGAEEARVRHAISLAGEGRTVALLCSGDAAIYAMAGLVLEVLESPDIGERERRIMVEVIPGVSALQAASARAGALIGHDFCAISLSDLLTPWEAIERRLKAAAEGDFVTALYNPRSQRRKRQLEAALAIFRTRRPAQTPVVIASRLGREGQMVRLLPLGEVDSQGVDMLSVVLIGSSESRWTADRARAWTPRGYHGKEKGP